MHHDENGNDKTVFVVMRHAGMVIELHDAEAVRTLRDRANAYLQGHDLAEKAHRKAAYERARAKQYEISRNLFERYTALRRSRNETRSETRSRATIQQVAREAGITYGAAEAHIWHGRELNKSQKALSSVSTRIRPTAAAISEDNGFRVESHRKTR